MTNPTRHPLVGIASIALACLCFTTAASADPGDRTARYLKAHIEDLEGEEVSLEVSYLEPMNRVDHDAWAFVIAHTHDLETSRSGESILVVIPKDELEIMLKLYGVSPDAEGRGRPGRSMETRRLSGGTIRQGERGPIYVDLVEDVEVTPAAVVGAVQSIGQREPQSRASTPRQPQTK